MNDTWMGIFPCLCMCEVINVETVRSAWLGVKMESIMELVLLEQISDVWWQEWPYILQVCYFSPSIDELIFFFFSLTPLPLRSLSIPPVRTEERCCQAAVTSGVAGATKMECVLRFCWLVGLICDLWQCPAAEMTLSGRKQIIIIQIFQPNTSYPCTRIQKLIDEL